MMMRRGVKKSHCAGHLGGGSSISICPASGTPSCQQPVSNAWQGRLGTWRWGGGGTIAIQCIARLEDVCIPSQEFIWCGSNSIFRKSRVLCKKWRKGGKGGKGAPAHLLPWNVAPSSAQVATSSGFPHDFLTLLLYSAPRTWSQRSAGFSSWWLLPPATHLNTRANDVRRSPFRQITLSTCVVLHDIVWSWHALIL